MPTFEVRFSGIAVIEADNPLAAQESIEELLTDELPDYRWVRIESAEEPSL